MIHIRLLSVLPHNCCTVHGLAHCVHSLYVDVRKVKDRKNMAISDNEVLVGSQELIAHLHEVGETQRAEMARHLHDVIASLMVAAVMDLSAVQASIPAEKHEAKARLIRAEKALQTAIDHSRRMVETLRPTILDNFGLFAALQWQLKMARRGSDVVITEHYPKDEPDMSADAATALFRVAEEAIGISMRRGKVTLADLQVSVDSSDTLHMDFSDNGVPAWMHGHEHATSVAIASMKHRLEALGGTVELEHIPGDGSVLKASLPAQFPAH